MNRSTVKSLASDTRGSLVVEKILLIALFCLVVGTVMNQVGDTIKSTFRSNAETAEASYVGPSPGGSSQDSPRP